MSADLDIATDERIAALLAEGRSAQSVAQMVVEPLNRVLEIQQRKPASEPDLFARASRIRDKRVQAVSERARAAMAKLHAAVTDYETSASARAEVARLERQLADAKARLRGKPTATAAKPGMPASIIRSWAKSAGVACPASGRVPNAVAEQYHAAHPEAAS